MEEILRICDDVTVMRDGRHVATERAADMTMDKIIKLMVGRELTERFPQKNNKIGKVALEVRDLCTTYAPIRDVSFSVRSGEIVGVAGLGGSGRTELLESIFGLCEKSGGEIRLHGRRIENKNPREAKKNGFALLTEERRATGIFGILDITDNTVVSGLSKYRFAGLFLNENKMKKDTEWSIKSMRIKTPSRTTKIRTLSGGNQQKVILGRWLLTEPEILLLDEPTRGIDVGAKYEIYQLIISLAESGKSVMMVSSEMPELLGVCDRILVMSGGRLAGELDAKEATQEKIMELASRFA
jgi:methyl-galactoside transport system ATP-binding protein